MRIYRGNYGWQYLAKGKTMDGEELKKYIGVKFSKNIIEPSGDEADIEFVRWFPTVYKKKDGSTDISFMVMEWKRLESRPHEQKSHQNSLGGELSNVEDKAFSIEPDDLPFY